MNDPPADASEGEQATPPTAAHHDQRRLRACRDIDDRLSRAENYASLLVVLVILVLMVFKP